MPQLFLLRRQCRESVLGYDVLYPPEARRGVARLVYDTLDEIVADDGAMVIGLHLLRELAIDEVEAIKKQHSVVRAYLAERQGRGGSYCCYGCKE